MNDTDQQLLSALLANKITEWYFMENYSGDLTNSERHIEELLNEAIILKSAEQIDFALSLASYFGLWKVDLVGQLNRLLLENWHYRHEDIVSLLQGLKSPSSVDPLYQTALKHFDYLSYDDTYGLAKKCTWALSLINTKEAIDKLRLLAQAENPLIQQYAIRRLDAQL